MGKAARKLQISKANQRRTSPYQHNNFSSSSVVLYKRHGQHLLKNPGILDKIIAAANIKSSETILEIGPGTGVLTMKLLPLAKRVIAIDVDDRMVDAVKKRSLALGYTNLSVMHGDALRTDFERFDVCTANLPYQISSPFVFKLLAHRPLFRCAVLMFQKEFAERLMAKPNEKNYGRLAVNCQLFCNVSRVCKVSPGSFNPPPQVESMVVKLVPRNPPLEVNFTEWDGLMRICFARKRKTLNALFNRNATLNMLETNYKTWCSLNQHKPALLPFKEYCLQVLDELELSKRRSISLDINSLFSLLLAFNRRGIHFTNVAADDTEMMDLEGDDDSQEEDD